MPGPAQVIININDLSFTAAQLTKGIAFVEGVTLRGPISDPKDVITSWPMFIRIFGGLTPGVSDFPLLCKIMLEKGTKLRVNRVAHYTTISDPSSLTAVKATIPQVVKITAAGALITSNTYNLTINGVAISAVPFNTNSDTTFDDIATAITAHSAVNEAIIVPASSGNVRSILIFGNTALTLTGGGGNAGAVTGGASQTTFTKTAVTGIVNASGVPLFLLEIKNHGADYNNVQVFVDTPSNNQVNCFNLIVAHMEEPSLQELYENVMIPNNTTAPNYTYLQALGASSKWVKLTYLDLTALAMPIRPVNATYFFSGGDDGDPVTIVDYSGDSAGMNGFRAFNGYNDSFIIAAPEISDVDLHTEGASYAVTRQDLQYFAHLDNSIATASDLITERYTAVVDTCYAAFFAGGIVITDPVTATDKEISELAHVINLATNTEDSVGAWRSFAGPTNGKIMGVLGVVHNFGGPGSSADLYLLANANINMVIDRDNKTMLWGNHSAQNAFSKLSQNSATRLVIHMGKTLRPTLEQFLEQPNDFITWRRMYNACKPYLDFLKGPDARALYSYEWRGDQNATKLSELVVNDPVQVGLGNYKIELDIDIIPSLVKITLNINVTPSGVSITALN